MIKEFTSEVWEKLGYYVYCLVDPRNKETFYIGKGIRNRVFNHVNAFDPNEFYAKAENKDFELTEENNDPAKIRTIARIKNKGLDVIHIILRWGMDEQTALNVEAALIDFVGVEKLTNNVRGHDTDRGKTTAEELQIKYGAKEFYYNPDDENYPQFILIKITDHSINLHKDKKTKEEKIYEAVRASWNINPNIANKYHYVLAVKNGIVIGVYEIYENGWKKDPKDKKGKRAYFDGEDAPEEIKEIFLYKKIPDEFAGKGSQNPVRYSDRKKKEKAKIKNETNKDANL